MPERDKAVRRMVEMTVGTRATDPITKRAPSVRKRDWEGLEAMMDEAFVEIVQTIDWGRVLMTAQARHEALTDADMHPDPPEHSALVDVDERAGLCPECVVNALLHESTLGSLHAEWKGNPDADQHPEWRDEWIEEAGGRLATFQRVLPKIMEGLDKLDQRPKRERGGDDD